MELNMIKRLLSDYGMILVLGALCILFSVLTLKKQSPQSDAAAIQLAMKITKQFDKSDTIVVAGAVNTDSSQFANTIADELKKSEFTNIILSVGTPRDLRITLDNLAESNSPPAAIATAGDTLKWPMVDSITVKYPTFVDCKVLTPKSRVWPDFLKSTNLLAIVDRIVVIAIIAIGMTMVIITAGIDLSVGSLIALSAVVGTLVMKTLGGLGASPWVVLLGFIAGTLACGVIGAMGGSIVAWFKVAPFITTLGIMMMARGMAFLITGGFSIYQVPKALPWLGQGRLMGIPNTVILLVILYMLAHIFMTQTRMGRYIYAVGGNKEAARLSGVPVKTVIVFVYIISSLAAGLGGCIQASQLNSGAPNIGEMYELYVIAAVVVGGTSLSVGSGKILGTLIGAFIISVIQNGMNLLGIESYTQKIVLGAVILIAVLLDRAQTAGGLTSFIKSKKPKEN